MITSKRAVMENMRDISKSKIHSHELKKTFNEDNKLSYFTFYCTLVVRIVSIDTNTLVHIYIYI